MQLTLAQLQALKADINSNTDQEVIDARSDGHVTRLAKWYNRPKNPAVKAWRVQVTVSNANDVIDWSEFNTVPVLGGNDLAGVKLAMQQNTTFARQNTSLQQLFRQGEFDASVQTIRNALQNIFANSPNTLAALTEIGKTNASNVEALFISGPVQGAGVRAFVGPVSESDVTKALYEV